MVLVWLYLLAIAVLIGAALNAAVDSRWPHGEARPPGEAARAPARAAGTLTPVRDTEAEQWQRHGIGTTARRRRCGDGE